jgi:hypothetical protein
MSEDEDDTDPADPFKDWTQNVLSNVNVGSKDDARTRALAALAMAKEQAPHADDDDDEPIIYDTKKNKSEDSTDDETKLSSQQFMKSLELAEQAAKSGADQFSTSSVMETMTDTIATMNAKLDANLVTIEQNKQQLNRETSNARTRSTGGGRNLFKNFGRLGGEKKQMTISPRNVKASADSPKFGFKARGLFKKMDNAFKGFSNTIQMVDELDSKRHPRDRIS